MKAFFSGIFWISAAVMLAVWALFVVDMTSYAKMGNTHELANGRIEIERAKAEVFQLLSGLELESNRAPEKPNAEVGSESESDPSKASKTPVVGETLLQLPASGEFGPASLLMVDHRVPDFVMYQERFKEVVFIHGIGLEEVRPGVTELSWEILSPNAQWWFHGFVMHPAIYLWDLRISETLKSVKETLEAG